jgi:hypothetical protein
MSQIEKLLRAIKRNPRDDPGKILIECSSIMVLIAAIKGVVIIITIILSWLRF